MKTMPQTPSVTLPVFLLAIGIHAAPTPAATPPKSDTPADYAYALPLRISGNQGVVGLRMPQAVYLNAKTAGLDDLRVFDVRGVAQPHALYRPPTELRTQRDSLPASIFPIRGNGYSASGNTLIDVDIQTRPDGSVKSVQARTGNDRGKAQGNDAAVLGSLILDFGAAAKGSENNPLRIEALRFSAPKEQTSYSAEVWLETSNDLKRWETIGAAELNWLSNDSAQTLASDRLEFSPQSFRYARLTWRRGEPVIFTAIQAETVNRQSSEPARETLWIKPVAGNQAGDLVYPAGIALPVEQIGLKLSEPNIVYPMTLGYYAERPSRQAGKTSEWVFQPKTQATFYQITQNGQTRRSGALNIGLGHRQEWVIRPQNASATARPELGLSWQPATLVFLAGGTPPYTLNFGRSEATPASQALSQVAPGFSPSELNQLEQAQAGELQTGPANVTADSAASQAGFSARQRTYVLWGVLLLGVAILGGMAWRLIRQMNAGSGKEK